MQSELLKCSIILQKVTELAKHRAQMARDEFKLKWLARINLRQFFDSQATTVHDGDVKLKRRLIALRSVIVLTSEGLRLHVELSYSDVACLCSNPSRLLRHKTAAILVALTLAKL